MDSKQTPKATYPIKSSKPGMGATMLGALGTFFGFSKGPRKSHAKVPRVFFKTPVGNKALPTAMQSEVMVCARNKRIRKDELRRAVHHMQKKLGHHKFA